MSTLLAPEIPAPGLSFDLCERNKYLEKKGFVAPKAIKTGTTIVGAIYKDGVIIGSDTRATEDTIVADKLCQKLYYLTENIYCCGAGTAADMIMTSAMISSKLELHRLNTGRVVPVITAEKMIKQFLFRHQGHIGAAFIIGGVDTTGPHLYCLYPHGSSEAQMYTTMGSGSLAAMAIFENRWKPDMTEEEAKVLVADAIRAGIMNDLASGSNVDMCVIRNNFQVDMLRPYEVSCERGQRQCSYRFKRGTTMKLTKKIRPIIIEEETVRKTEPESMDTSS